MPEVSLLGCRTTPLMSYLKALGVLRHVSKEDPAARLWWDVRGHAMLRSNLGEDGLVDFFMDRYEPSPITSPWNGGSGYYPKDARGAIDAVAASIGPRFSAYRDVIAAARSVIRGAGEGEPEGVADKHDLLERWRGQAPDGALEWIDATMALGDAGPGMNPLLGTGGNDGRFEFSNNHMQRLVDCLPGEFGGGAPVTRRSWARLTLALLGSGRPELDDAPVGMFDPGAAGLPNSTSSPRVGPLVNPWDFVLMLEGVLLFAGSVGRRLDGAGASFAFTMRGGGVTRVGRSLSSDADANTRGETWLPVWRRPASVGAIFRMLAEGRMQDGREQARSGRTAARAAASLGVERGIDAFERIVFVERFGRNYVAVPVGRIDVVARPALAELVRGADRWLAGLRRVDSAAIRHGLAVVERAEAEVVSRGTGLERWLVALSELQLVVAARPGLREPAHGIRPLGRLSGDIARRLDDGSAETAIALALAAVGRAPRPRGEPPPPSLRALLEPVRPDRSESWVWTDARPLGRGLTLKRPGALLAALAVACANQPPPVERFTCPLWAVQRFLDAETDDDRIVRLALALQLCDVEGCGSRPPPDLHIDRLYALVRLVCGPQADPSHRPAPEATRLLATGQPRRAATVAAARLSTDGRSPLMRSLGAHRTPLEARRIAAALAIPIRRIALLRLEHAVLAASPADTPPPKEQTDD